MKTDNRKSRKDMVAHICEELSTLPYVGEMIGVLPLYGNMIEDISRHHYKLHAGTKITLVVGTVCLVIPKEKLTAKFPLVGLLDKKLVAAFIRQALRAELEKYAEQINSPAIEWEEYSGAEIS